MFVNSILRRSAPLCSRSRCGLLSNVTSKASRSYSEQNNHSNFGSFEAQSSSYTNPQSNYKNSSDLNFKRGESKKDIADDKTSHMKSFGRLLIEKDYEQLIAKMDRTDAVFIGRLLAALAHDHRPEAHQVYKYLEEVRLLDEGMIATYVGFLAATQSHDDVLRFLETLSPEVTVRPRLLHKIISSYAQRDMVEEGSDLFELIVNRQINLDARVISAFADLYARSKPEHDPYVKTFLDDIIEYRGGEEYFTNQSLVGIAKLFKSRTLFGHTYELSSTTMTNAGVCSGCGEHVKPLKFDEDSRHILKSSIEKLMIERLGEAAVKEFDSYIKPRQIDLVIDGLNVGFSTQTRQASQAGGFRFKGKMIFNINALHEVIEICAKNNKRPLVLLRSHIVSEYGQSHNHLMRRWNEIGSVYVVPNFAPDDLFWLYATLSGSVSRIITNDLMRDALIDIDPDFRIAFLKWQRSHMVKVLSKGGGFRLTGPPVFDVLPQHNNETGSYHFPLYPCVESHLYSTNVPKKWLCCHPKKPATAAKSI